CIENIPLVSVIGESRVDVKPDVIIIKVSTSRYIKIPDLNVAKENVLIQMKFVEREGIEIAEMPDILKKDQVGIQYIKEFVITVRDFRAYYELFQKLQQNGFTDFRIVEFQVSNLGELKQKARILALNDAKQKAASMAGELGQAIGKAHRVEEVEVSYNSTFGPDALLLFSADWIRLNDRYPVKLGHISVIAKLKVSFDLKK
ncbi:MAG TPA: SIMPL domain-containing protein, partial [Cytophagales bacterium]|nr:SIMPL domain-containing protein [Cytophagales bacterium]